MKKKPAKETSAKATQVIDEMKKKGIKVLSFYWTLGRYDMRSSAFFGWAFSSVRRLQPWASFRVEELN